MPNNRKHTISGYKPETVGEFIELMLMLEGSIQQEDLRIQSAKSILQELVPDMLDLPATNTNLAIFELSLYKKDRAIAEYYSQSLRQYLRPVDEKSQSNDAFGIVKKLLVASSIIVHPDNEVEKYFKDTNYSFSCGIKCEPYYKYVPDETFQEMIQQVTQRRVAFLMTLIQMRSSSFGALSKIYKKGVYSRELSLSILFHVMESFDFNSTIYEQYKAVKNAFRKNIKSGTLELPERRLFRLISPRKKLLLRKEYKTFFNQKDFAQNDLLKILVSYRENMEKVMDQVFPVVAVRDPISGNMLKISLTREGVRAAKIEEIEIPKLYTITDDNLNDYIRKQIAKKIANDEHISLNRTVASILAAHQLDSDQTTENITTAIRPSVIQADTFGHKILFFLNDYDPAKTVAGNLSHTLISKTALSSNLKENIETATNIPGISVLAAAAGMTLGGLPIAIFLGAATWGASFISKRESLDSTSARGYLSGARGLSQKDIDILTSQQGNTYFELMKLLTAGNQSAISSYKNLFKRDTSALSKVSQVAIAVRNRVEFFSTAARDILFLATARLGIDNAAYSRVRRYRENAQTIKYLSNSAFDKSKRDETFDLLGMIAKSAGIFGYLQAINAANMLKTATNSTVKTGLIGAGLLAKGVGDRVGTNSFLYSFVGRNLQKGVYGVGQALGFWSRRNVGGVVMRINTAVGAFSSNVTNGLFLDRPNMMNRATASLGCIVLGLGVTAVFMSLQLSPLINAQKTAYASPSLFAGASASSSQTYSENTSTKKVLNVNYFNQYIPLSGAESPERVVSRNSMCGAASAVMVANFYGFLPSDNLRSFMFDDTVGGYSQIGNHAQLASVPPRPASTSCVVGGDPNSGAFMYTSGGSCSLDGSTPAGIAAYLRGLGDNVAQPISWNENLQRAYVGGIATNTEYKNQLVQQIYSSAKTSIDAGKPLILSIRKPVDHIFVIRGYTTDNATGNVNGVVVNDPYSNLSLVKADTPAANLPTPSASGDTSGNNAVYDLNGNQFILLWLIST